VRKAVRANRSVDVNKLIQAKQHVAKLHERLIRGLGRLGAQGSALLLDKGEHLGLFRVRGRAAEGDPVAKVDRLGDWSVFR
jgi:hypothetical protein